MRKESLFLLYLFLGFSYCSPTEKSSSENVSIESAKDDTRKQDTLQELLPYDIARYLHTESRQLHSSGKAVVIQNAYPKGGGSYFDSSDLGYSYGIFWKRIINNTPVPVEFTINFPSDSIIVSNTKDAFFKLVLTPDTMHLDKLSSFDYGLTGFRAFLDSTFHKPSTMKRIIPPSEEHIFNIAILMHVQDNGRVRTALLPREGELFYRVDIVPYEIIEIPCGKIVFRE